MVEVSLKRERQFKDNLKLAGTKEGQIKALLITGIGVYIAARLSDPELYDVIKNYHDRRISVDVGQDINKKVINVAKNKKKIIDNKQESITVNDWCSKKREEKELRQLFLNMDMAMKFIHKKNYCIKSFDPREIEILNNSIKQIQFNELLKMPKDVYDRKELVKEDIYSAAFLHLGIYMYQISCGAYSNQTLDDILKHINPKFLRDDFDKFTGFPPKNDIPYYRGIFKRGASVYFSDFDYANVKQMTENIQKQIDSNEGNEWTNNTSANSNSNSKEKPKTLTKATNAKFGNFDEQNNDIYNKNIYSSINNDAAAFVKAFVIPAIMVIFGIVLIVLSYINSN